MTKNEFRRLEHDERVALTRQVRRVRQDRGMTQAELAEAAGVSRQTVSNMEAGGRVPHDHVLKSLLDVLGIDPADSDYSADTAMWLGLIGGVLETVPSERRPRAGRAALDAATDELMSSVGGDHHAVEGEYRLAASERSDDRGEDADY